MRLITVAQKGGSALVRTSRNHYSLLNGSVNLKKRTVHNIADASRCLSGIDQWHEDLTTDIKKKIEKHWGNKLYQRPFTEDSHNEKFYMLSMMPYSSGKLHMGHIRVYSISDAFARFYRMTGRNVIHPMSWDAFGLPAENAAIEKGVDPDRWSQDNIASMKEHLEEMNLSFDWDREFATCDSDYYKWTQFLFLKLYENDLVYQKKAFVNWDPVDQTVLADEQVDEQGKSWRSGAKVERKMLSQWFIRTTRFAKELYDGLDDPMLEDWNDVVKMQKEWIGECTGTKIDFEIVDDTSCLHNKKMTIWLRYPELIDEGKFVAVRPNTEWAVASSSGKMPYRVKNPFTTDVLPVYVTEEAAYAEQVETHLGLPEKFEADQLFAESVSIPPSNRIKSVMTDSESAEYRDKICAEARNRGIGGYITSSKLRDWLVSRQRYWGTPIPMVYCKSCGGAHPVPESDLPVKLPPIKKIEKGKNPLLEAKDWLTTTCPKCGGVAQRETDTLDTFVDSSWYFLRFLSPDNKDIPFEPEKAKQLMPVDLYIGGKEHAVLHLYYARFFNHFLYSAGLVPHPEPFKRLLVQGIVKGQTFRRPKTSEYVHPSMVEMTGNKAVHKETKETLVVQWEKMSKSKHNGVEPSELFEEFGVDTTRMIILADVPPMTSRNWSRVTFTGVLRWQRRLWIAVQKFLELRNQNLPKPEESDDFKKQHEHLRAIRNTQVRNINFNFYFTNHISVAISKMQELSNTMKQSTDEVIAFSSEYEKALAALIISLAPIAPHFASELWAGFAKAPNRLNTTGEILWDKPVLLQPWPKVDRNHELSLTLYVGKTFVCSVKLPKPELNKLTLHEAFALVRRQESVRNLLAENTIYKVRLEVQKNVNATLSFLFDARDQNVGKKKTKKEEEEEEETEEAENLQEINK